jgi:molybdopterin-containing oxidoreductase family membrane subunit
MEMQATNLPITLPRWAKPAYYVVVSFLALVGVVAVLVRLIYGMKVTALTSPIPWGMWVAIYIYFIGLSAGSFLMSTLVYVFGMHRYEKVGRMALLSALFALFGGMLFIWIDLGHPERFWHIFTRWNPTSVLAWECFFYLFYIVAILCELWFLMRCDLASLAESSEGWRATFYRFVSLGFRCPKTAFEWQRCHAQSMRVVRTIGIIGIPIAIGVHGGTGAIFAVVAARPYWYTPLFPIIFLVSALASGAALMAFLYAFFGKRDEDYAEIVKGMANFALLFLTIDMLLMAAEFLVGFYGHIPEHLEVYRQILFGPFPYTFWLGQLFFGTILPVTLVSWKRTRQSVFWLGVAGLSAVVGIVAVRLNLVIPALVVPVLKGLDKAFFQPRWSFRYFPSFWEWASTIGLIALIVLGFSIAYELLPMFGVVEEKFSGGER